MDCLTYMEKNGRPGMWSIDRYTYDTQENMGYPPLYKRGISRRYALNYDYQDLIKSDTPVPVNLDSFG